MAGAAPTRSPGQWYVALLGVGGLLVLAVVVFTWASRPPYAPVFAGLAPKDAAAVVDQLAQDGTPYRISGDAGTVLVPSSEVDRTRMSLAAAGLPTAAPPADQRSSATVATDLERSIDTLDGVHASVVRLAVPVAGSAGAAQPTAASVLVDTQPGTSLTPGQVQAVVHLVSSSTPGLDPNLVTVADSSGRVLSQPAPTGTAQDAVTTRVQSLLDRVVGPGNSTVVVAADVNRDHSSVAEHRYWQPKANRGLATASARTFERYRGYAAAGTTPASYRRAAAVVDSALDEQLRRTQVAPGALRRLQVSVAVDRAAAAHLKPAVLSKLVAAAAGIVPSRGDRLRVAVLPFDHSAQLAAARQLKGQAAAAASAGRLTRYRDAGIAGLALLLLLAAWLRARRKEARRRTATAYVVERLRERGALPAGVANDLAAPDSTPAPDLEREQLRALVEAQPTEVASVLRGWLDSA